MKPKTISFMEKRLIEEAGGVVAPFPVETVAHIAHGPGNDDGVVEGNKESDKHLEPAREFPPAANASESRILARNLLPRPSPSEAPFTMPAMSTKDTVAGTMRFALNISCSFGRRLSGSSTTPTLGSMVAKG